jgi:hypothetical protein
MAEELCVTLLEGGTPQPHLPPSIKIIQIAARTWDGYYCIPGINFLYHATLSCNVNPISGLDEWDFTVLLTTCDGTLTYFSIRSTVGGGLSSTLACSSNIWTGSYSGPFGGGTVDIRPDTCPDNNYSYYGTGTGTNIEDCFNCPGTGSGTATGTSGCCSPDTVFCADDGLDQVTLNYIASCLWAGSNAGTGTNILTDTVYDPLAGTIRRGSFPDDYADYSGPTGCSGGTFNKTFTTGSTTFPEQITITIGSC